MKIIKQTTNYFTEEKSKSELMIKKHKKVCNFKLYWTLAYLVSAFTRCVSISAFASLVGIPMGTASSLVGLNICAITAGI